jgi:tetratricopeptide (TPR) repeat protein
MNNSRTVRIFLSSTFRDFGEERDLLVKRVFPALRARLKDRFVELVDVDLRWGITVEEAERGEVLPICLAEIDRARPYFICMLGERYGWIPPPEGYATDLLERQPWLKKHQGGKSVTELEILHGVLNSNRRMRERAFFYFRSPAYARHKGGDYLPSDEDRARQARLKRSISDHGLRFSAYSTPEALAKRIERDLWKLLDAEFPAASVPDAFEREQLKHESYAVSRRHLYLGGEKYHAALEKMLHKDAQRILIEGSSGGGKSALIANFFKDWRNRYPKHLVHEHYLSASADAADPYALVRRLVEFIQRRTQSSLGIADDPQQLMDSLPQWLATASAWACKRKTRLIIVLDSFNSLTQQTDLRWWPSFLPPAVSVVVSCLPGQICDALKTKVDAGAAHRRSSIRPWQSISVKPLSRSQTALLLSSYLARFNKKLPNNLVRQVLAHPLSSNPLFLRTLAEELRVFGVHEELQRTLDTALVSQTVDDLFEFVLQRVENDFGRVGVRDGMTAIWASRSGLLEKEILSIAGLSPASWAAIRHALGDGLQEISGRLTFAHGHLRTAVADRYLGSAVEITAAHQKLARWFGLQSSRARRAEEEAWQLRAAGDRPGLLKCLGNHDRFMAMYEYRGTEEIANYWLGIEASGPQRLEPFMSNRWTQWVRHLDARGQRQASDAVVELLTHAGHLSRFTLRLARLGLDLARQERGLGRAGLIPYINMLAVLLKDCGRYVDAEPLYQEALALARRLGPSQRESLCNRLNNLAVFYRRTGRLQQAEVLYRESLAISTELFGGQSESVATILTNLVPVLRLTGRLAEALETVNRAIGALRRINGEDDPTLLLVLNNKGQVLKSMQKRHEAEKCFVEALQLGRRLLGPAHPNLALVLNNLSELRLDLNDHQGAMQAATQALEIRKASLPSLHPDIGASLLTLGDCAKHVEDRVQSTHFFTQAASHFREAGLKDDEASAYNRLGIDAHEANDLPLAQKHYRQALDLLNESGHHETQQALTLLNNMAMLLKEQDKLTDALDMAQRALKLRQRLYPERLDKLAISNHNVGSIYEEMGESESALKYYGKWLRLLEKVFGQVHEELLDSLVSLGTLRVESGHASDGIKVLRRALHIAEQRLGPDHSQTGMMLYHLGGALGEVGEVGEAEPILRREIQIAILNEGAVSDSVRLSMRRLGVLLRDHGSLESANELLTGALDLSIKLYGDESSEIASELSALGQLRIQQNLLTDAQYLLERSLKIRNADPDADEQAIRSVRDRLDLVMKRLHP